MSNPIEIDVVTQTTQATDLALEDLFGELDDDPTRTAEGRTRTENTRGDASLSPDSFQVLPRTTPMRIENPRGLTETQMIRDRELLSIMEDISETTARSPGRGMRDAVEDRVGADVVGLVESGGRNASGSIGRSADVENRTAVGRDASDRNLRDENRTAVGSGAHGRSESNEPRTAVGRVTPDRSLHDEKRTAVGNGAHGRFETAETGRDWERELR